MDDVELKFKNKDKILVSDLSEYGQDEIFLDPNDDKEQIEEFFSGYEYDNIKKYSYDSKLSEDDNLENKNNIQVEDVDKIDFTKDNMLIKCNNLIGLNKLKEDMKGKVDVIYIDPPYYFNKSKGKKKFAYNSNFKLSTWLTFMKNRLEIARELLSDSGFIFISIDEDGQGYLKILCDDIFNFNNYLGDIIWDKRNPKGNVKHLSILTENIISYSKNKFNLLTFNKLLNKKNGIEKLYFKRDELFKKFKNNIKSLKEINNEYSKYVSKLNIKEGLKAYKFIDENGDIYRGVSIDSPSKSKNRYNVVHPKTKKNCKVPSNGWRIRESEMLKLIKNDLIIFGLDENTIPNKKQFLKDYEMEIMTNLFSYAGSGLNDLEKLSMSKYLFKNPKPCKLINYLLEHSSKNSTILDFFAGSGTTAHSVLSLNKEDGGNRKFILLEQMDYIENITAERIRRCMIKEGYEDSFVYCELNKKR